MWIEPGRINPDIFLSSHEHADHLDIDAIPEMLEGAAARGYVNEPSMKELRKNDIQTEKFSVIYKGDEIDFKEFKLIVTDCDHGETCPEALGFYLDFGFLTLYYSGDTCLNAGRLSRVIEKGADVALLPVNGAYGNLNAGEAAKYAGLLGAKVCVPMHFWTFPAHEDVGGTPGDAIREFPVHAPNCHLYLATPGEMMIFGSKGECR